MCVKRFHSARLPEFQASLAATVPNDEIRRSRQVRYGQRTLHADGHLCDKVLFPKHLIHHRPDAVDVFITDLYEDGTGISEEIAGDGEAVAEVGEVAVNTVAPRIPERLHLLWLTGNVVGLSVLYVAGGGRPLEVAVEF